VWVIRSDEKIRTTTALLVCGMRRPRKWDFKRFPTLKAPQCEMTVWNNREHVMLQPANLGDFEHQYLIGTNVVLGVQYPEYLLLVT
jgi:hypothetical protein